MFDDLIELASASSGWAYAALLLVALVDALVPVVPSETAVIAAGVVAAGGELELSIVAGSAAIGAIAGDNSAYLLGRRYSGAIRRFSRRERMRRRLVWAERQLAERGAELITIGRFVPGGRTAVTLSAGTLRFPWRRFAIADGAAASVWGLYASLLGFFGGRVFEAAPWKGLVLALTLALAATAVFELVRWRRRRRR